MRHRLSGLPIKIGMALAPSPTHVLYSDSFLKIRPEIVISSMHRLSGRKICLGGSKFLW